MKKHQRDSGSKDSEKGYQKESLFNFKNHKVEKTTFCHIYIYVYIKSNKKKQRRNNEKEKKEKKNIQETIKRYQIIKLQKKKDIDQRFSEFQQYEKILVKIHLRSYRTNSS